MSSSSTISSRETRGYFFLFLLFSSINLFGPAIIDSLFPPAIPEIKIEQIEPPGPTAIDSTVKQPVVTDFNINTVTKDELKRMGVHDQAASTWIKFRNTLGGFQEVDQIKEIYGLKSQTISRLMPHARVSEQVVGEQSNSAKSNEEPVKTEQAETSGERSDTSFSRQTAEKAIEKINLNTATAEELIKLRGIGPVFSERIIAFRDALGGFYAVEQLAETYGLPPETYQSIRSKLNISEGWRRLDINSANVEELAKHPYISWDMAGMIVRYREQNGTYNTKRDLNRLHGLSEEELNKAIHYLEAVPLEEDIAAKPAVE